MIFILSAFRRLLSGFACPHPRRAFPRRRPSAELRPGQCPDYERCLDCGAALDTWTLARPALIAPLRPPRSQPADCLQPTADWPGGAA